MMMLAERCPAVPASFEFRADLARNAVFTRRYAKRILRTDA